MAEYIEREALMSEIHRIGGHNLCEWDTLGVKALVERQPTADVVEVRHGEWRPCSFDPQYPYFVCTNCRTGYSTIYHEGKEMKYCPDCGAKMDEGV